MGLKGLPKMTPEAANHVTLLIVIKRSNKAFESLLIVYTSKS